MASEEGFPMLQNNSMEQFLKGDSSPDIQEYPNIVWNPKVQYRAHWYMP
jgi:hypothetical protein